MDVNQSEARITNNLERLFNRSHDCATVKLLGKVMRSFFPEASEAFKGLHKFYRRSLMLFL